MKRLNPVNINTPEYYVEVWGEEVKARSHYDTVRMKALAKYVKNGDMVLDVGAGVFGTAQFIAEHTNISADLHAVDFSHTARDIVNERYPQIKYKVADFARQIPYASDSFDCVISGEVIEHMEYPELYAKELLRVCKPDGWITLTTVDTSSEDAKKRKYPEHVWEYEPEDLVRFFSPHRTKYSVLGNYHLIECQK